jgi:hypothetical protein
MNNRHTKFTIVKQGDVIMADSHGYLLVGDGDAVCFFIDPEDKAYIESAGESANGCPVIHLYDDEDCENLTEIEFSEFPGWRFHAGGGGKSIAIALVRR